MSDHPKISIISTVYNTGPVSYTHLANGTEGLLYGDALDADALARAVLQVLHSPDGGTAMGRAARARALQTHDAARNAADLLHIYESILQEEHP